MKSLPKPASLNTQIKPEPSKDKASASVKYLKRGELPSNEPTAETDKKKNERDNKS